MDFFSTHAFSMNKMNNSANYIAGRIINCRTHHNSLCRDKNKHLASYVVVYKAMSHVNASKANSVMGCGGL
jgi:hypothetical protein